MPLSTLMPAACCLLPVLWGCDIETKSKSEYCSEMPAVVCARLFDEGCAAISGNPEPRHDSKEACVAAEKQACEARAADSRLSFDEEKAAACITEIEDQDCSKAARGDLHECDKVFTEGDAGVAPVTALDAGTPGDSGGDL